MGSGSQSSQGSWVSTDLPAHLLHVAATQARVVKGEVGPFVVPGPLDLHRSLLHKNLSGLGPRGPEAAVGLGRAWGRAVHGSGLAGGFCNTRPNPLVPFLEKYYHRWLLRKSQGWGACQCPLFPLWGWADWRSISGVQGEDGGSREKTVTVYQALPTSLASHVPWIISWDSHKTYRPQTHSSAENIGVHVTARLKPGWGSSPG